jgi:diguanylate cyclase (GGDEF)-like protein
VVTGLALACTVVLFGALTLLAVRQSRRRSEQRLEAVLVEIDGRLEAISASVAQALERANERRDGVQLFLTLDFDGLVDSLVTEAASRTGADAVVVRVDGPGGRPVVASRGAGVGGEQLERAFGPPDARTFVAATTDWTYRATEEEQSPLVRSSLVTPINAAGVTGVVAAYSVVSGAFTREHVMALAMLVDEVAPALANARRFAEVEARTLLDPATGVASPRGYELELEREVARAHRSGRPLSMVLVGVESTVGTEAAALRGNGVAELGRLLKRVTRATDISCRRGEREFAILLPGTQGAGATRLTRRLRDEAVQTLGVGQSNLTVGFVEWRPDETFEALDARADVALGRHVAVLEPLGSRGPATEPPVSDLRRDALETLAQEVAQANRLERSLALVVLDVDDLDGIAERYGLEAADSVLHEVARRLDESVGAGSVHRLGPDEFALVLSSSTAHDAEALLGAVQASLAAPAAERVTLCAGITELANGESASAALERAEHALWQAKQVGRGTVVVAVPSSGKRRPD